MKHLDQLEGAMRAAFSKHLNAAEPGACAAQSFVLVSRLFQRVTGCVFYRAVLTAAFFFSLGPGAAEAQVGYYVWSCERGRAGSYYSDGIQHPTLSAATEAMRTTVASDTGVANCKRHRLIGSHVGISAQPQNLTYDFRPSLEDPVSYYIPGAIPAPTPEAACRNYYENNTLGQVVFHRIFRYTEAPFLNWWACTGWFAAQQRETGAVFVHWTCDPPATPSSGDATWGVPHGPYCMARYPGGIFSFHTASSERPQQCPLAGNPIQVNSEEKIERDLDYPGRTLAFKRFYGSQKVSQRPNNALIHSFGDHIYYYQSENGVSQFQSNGTVQRFGGTSLQSLSADTRTPITATTATAAGEARWKISSLTEPRIDVFDYSGRNLQQLHADGRTVRFTHIDAGGSRVPATAPTCTVLVDGIPVPNEATPSTLQCVTDDFGRQLNFRYSVRTVDGAAVQVNLVQMIDPAGNIYQYTYDEATSVPGPTGRLPANNLTSVTYPDGYRRLYHYNEPENTSGAQQTNALTGVTEVMPTFEPIRLSTFKYDSAGRAIYTERAGAIGAYSVNYSTPRREVVVTDPLGTQRTQSFSTVAGVERPIGGTQPPGSGSTACSDAMTYDAQGNVASRIDFNGNKTCYAYDLTRNLQIKRVEGLPASASCSAALTTPPAGARTITTQWHPEWRLQTAMAAPKRITTSVYNGQGTTCAPSDALVDGRPVAVVCSTTEQATTDESGAAGFGATPTGAPRTSRSTYTSYGRLLTATDANDKTTTYTYHSDDNADSGKRGNLATSTNPANHVTAYTDYNLHGQATRVVDANGLVTTSIYDVRLRLRSRIAGAQVTMFDYHPAGHLTQATLANGATLTYGHDAAHRMTSVQDQKGNRIGYTLNGLGARTGEEVRDPSGALVKNMARVVDALNRFERVTGER